MLQASFWYFLVRKGRLLPMYSQHMGIINFNKIYSATSTKRKLHGFLLLSQYFPLGAVPDPINNTFEMHHPVFERLNYEDWKKTHAPMTFSRLNSMCESNTTAEVPISWIGCSTITDPTTRLSCLVLSFAWFLWSVTHPQRKFTLNGVASLYGV